jgi:carbon-monoxide dehydrogenase large subunit
MPTTSQRVWRAIQAGKGNATQETPVDTHSPGAGLGSIDPNNPQGEVQ